MPKMQCGVRLMSLISLTFGLVAAGALSLAVATDYWIFTDEPYTTDPQAQVMTVGNETFITEPIIVKTHSGLWRACVYYDLEDVDGGSIPSMCANIGYLNQGWERPENGDTTGSILRAIRRASPVIVSSLLVLVVAFGVSTVGNAKKNVKTLYGAVLYILAALGLAIGVIFYVSAVNDEVAHRKKPSHPDEVTFRYYYGWAFFFAGSSFICAMIAAVSNISLYLRRHSNLEDMIEIIPGLEKKSNYDYRESKREEAECEAFGTQNPTIIL